MGLDGRPVSRGFFSRRNVGGTFHFFLTGAGGSPNVMNDFRTFRNRSRSSGNDSRTFQNDSLTLGENSLTPATRSSVLADGSLTLRNDSLTLAKDSRTLSFTVLLIRNKLSISYLRCLFDFHPCRSTVQRFIGSTFLRLKTFKKYG